MKQNEAQGAFTIVEMLVCIAIIGILLCMLMPVTRSVGEASKRTQCLNNLRQIALASLNYESAHMSFPMATGFDVEGATSNAAQYSGFVAILPFMEQNQIHKAITEGLSGDGVEYTPFPALYGDGFPIWKNKIPTLLCPSMGTSDSKAAATHYGFCIGDRARNIAKPETIRGAFGNPTRLVFDDMTDGSSNTILFGEIATIVEGENESPFAINQSKRLLENPAACFDLIDGDPQSSWTFQREVMLSPIGRGGHWADGRAGVGLFNTILPPKSPAAAVGGSVGVDGIYSASGPHPGTVNVVFGDASVHTIDVEINTGDVSQPTLTAQEMAEGKPTPYGVWGALGTSNLGDIATDF